MTMTEKRKPNAAPRVTLRASQVMGDRRTKRNRTRGAQERRAIKESDDNRKE